MRLENDIVGLKRVLASLTPLHQGVKKFTALFEDITL